MADPAIECIEITVSSPKYHSREERPLTNANDVPIRQSSRSIKATNCDTARHSEDQTKQHMNQPTTFFYKPQYLINQGTICTLMEKR